MSVSVEKEGYGSYRTSVALEPGPTNRLEGGAETPLKLTGVAWDGAGAPLARVELALWPEWQANSKDTTPLALCAGSAFENSVCLRFLFNDPQKFS